MAARLAATKEEEDKAAAALEKNRNPSDLYAYENRDPIVSEIKSTQGLQKKRPTTSSILHSIESVLTN